MRINTDINILGGLTDWGLLKYFIVPKVNGYSLNDAHLKYSNVKTEKSVQRFERAVRNTLLHFKNGKLEDLYNTALSEETLSSDTLLMLFWNSSANNDLFLYLNKHVFFPAFYTGKLLLKKEDVTACLKDLRETETALQEWSLETIDTVARKYLALLKSFNLLTPTLKKTILHPYLNDKMFVLFIYWIKAIDDRTNILESPWMAYSLSEKAIFLERLMQKKYSVFFDFTFTGDMLKVNTLYPYSQIYHAIK